MESFDAICSGCSKGCNITVDHRKEKYKNDEMFIFNTPIDTHRRELFKSGLKNFIRCLDQKYRNLCKFVEISTKN